MVYQGSKARIVKDLMPLLTRHLTKDRWFVDLFCGGCNVVSGLSNHPLRMANDKNPYLIALFRHVCGGYSLPAVVTREQYEEVRTHMEDFQPWYVGYVGFVCSARGKFFNCYAGRRETQGKHGEVIVRDFNKEMTKNLLRQVPRLQGVEFRCSSYDKLEIPPCSVVYCDPPYKGTSRYRDVIDTAAFWDWCRQATASGHDVLISEYEAPSDFVPVWRKNLASSLFTGGRVNSTEFLFVHESIADKYNDVGLFKGHE